MGSRLLWRRSATAVGLYASTLLGILGTVVAARVFDLETFGVYATVMVATGFFQSLLDLTVEESLTKYGFRYATAQEWGRLRRIFRRALQLKIAGGVLGGLALLALSPFADGVFGAEGLATPLAVAALLPLVQAPENVAATAILLRGRYDVRGAFQTLSMALRLTAIVVGTRYGITETIAAIVIAQVVATTAVGIVGILAFRRFPAAPSQGLSDDRRAILGFVVQSSAATGLLSLRAALAPLLLGVVAGPVQVGLLRIAQAPQTGLNALSSPVRLILLTEQTREWEEGQMDRVLRVVRRYAAAAAALMAGVVPLFLWLMPDVIRLVFGSRYVGAVDAARVILVAAAFQLVWGWTKSFPISIGRPGLRLVTHGIETAVLLPLVVLLGLRYGATGAAVAVLVASVVFAAAWTILYERIRREVRRAPRVREALAP